MNETRSISDSPDAVEMPAPTVAPLVLALGVTLTALGLATSPAFSAVGLVLFVGALARWIGQLLPGRGHEHLPRVAPEARPRPVATHSGTVERIRQGMPGYRLRLPERVHPVSSGVKGGIAGGIVMPVPALVYGWFSGHGLWMPINLLAGMAVPGVGEMTVEQLEQFHPDLFALAACIHASVSLIAGLVYGVLMPTLPNIPKPLAWGALLMPLLWSAASFSALGIVNPVVRARLDWPWFVVSQFIFGVVAALVYMRLRAARPIAAGFWAGVVGGLLMPIPALLWGILTRHGIWYPVNLLAAMAVRHSAEMSLSQLEDFRADWLVAAVIAHVVFSLVFGMAFGLVLPRVATIPAALAWGGLLFPLMWTAASYGLMGVVNPALQEYVDWPWFIVSQFVFGVVASLVILRSQQIKIPPAGAGPERLSRFIAP